MTAPMLAARLRAKPHFGRRLLIALVPAGTPPPNRRAAEASGFDDVVNDCCDTRHLTTRILRGLRTRPELRCVLPPPERRPIGRLTARAFEDIRKARFLTVCGRTPVQSVHTSSARNPGWQNDASLLNAASSPGAAAATRDHEGRPVVLVVDDHVDSRDLMAAVLQEVGVAIAEAGTGAAALERVAMEPRPSLIMIDLSLPDRHGTEVVKALKADAAVRRHPRRRAERVGDGIRQGCGRAGRLRGVHREARAAG